MRNILKVVFVIIGTFIGAGFASGQEVYTFFYVYGLNGIYGIIISGIVIASIIYKVFEIIRKNNVETYKEFLDITIKSKNKQTNEKVKKIINVVINVFILVTYFIMIAGFGAYLEQEFGINQILGSTILAILTYIVATKKNDSILKINQVIIPALIAIILFISWVVLKDADMNQIRGTMYQSQSGYVLTSLVYASYNSILIIPILITLKKHIKTKKQVKCISTISSLIIMILGIVIYLVLTRITIDISTLEMPAVYAIGQVSKVFKYVYGIVLLSAIFTTSISLQASFLQNTVKQNSQYNKVVILMATFGILISKIGFATLVNYLYQLLGYLGLIQIANIYAFREKINIKY